jgi:hypothetical protein
MDHIIWYFSSIESATRLMPLLWAALACIVLYQIDCSITLAAWLAKKARLISSDAVLEPENRHSAILVLPTLLRSASELAGLVAAMRSAARNNYPGRLLVVACIDGTAQRADLFEQLRRWAKAEPVPANVELHVAGTTGHSGKAVAMNAGVEYVKDLVAQGRLPEFPVLFFNMDADSSLGPRALERMAFKLTRKRRLARTPHLIVTSNVQVPVEECWSGLRSLVSVRHWIALLVAREYLTSISLGRHNSKLLSATGVSGALYCTWSQAHLAAPRYARFMQSLHLVDWLKWWLGFAPPRFSEFKGTPLPEAMTGPGDDTWMAWMACTGTWKGSRICFDAPRTPVHALARMVLSYVSRPLGYDPLAKVYTKTPTKFAALFRQRLRWNSSRVQDLLRWAGSNAFHWQVAFPALLGVLLVVVSNLLLLVGLLAPLLVTETVSRAIPLTLMAAAGYAAVRTVGTIAALVVSESSASDWIKLSALPLAGIYHFVFNTLTTIIGFWRDTFGFGEPTTFSPETTLRKSRLTRIALAYRTQRALLLACRAAIFGDVPLGWFWFGWRETPWTSSGFDGWSSGLRPPPVYWPGEESDRPGRPPAFSGPVTEP